MAVKKSKRKEVQTREKEYISLQKSIAVMASVGFLINSITAAGAIKGDSSFGTKVNTNGNVHNITTENINGSNAFNKFDEFKLDANNIANMHFGQQNTKGVENLFNFVNGRVDIHGTVNAIKENKIGGNLYFLSSDGMVIGNTGVVNTGALYMITPTKDVFDTAVEMAKIKKNGTEVKYGTPYPGLIPGKDGNISIPLNPKGTITVRGQVNAVNHIGLYAANVEVGNVGTLDSKNEGAAYQNKVNLKTGVVEFSNLVNINNIESGLNGKALEATKTGDGDIVLMARANEIKSKASVDGIFYENTATDISAKIEINGKIESAGNVTLDAYAMNGTHDKSAIPNPSSGTPAEDVKYNGAYAMANVTSTIEIKKDAVITSAKDKDITIKSKAENVYESSALDHAGKNVPLEILGTATSLNVDVGRYELASNSKINIESGAKVTSGGKLTLNSSSEAGIKAGASTSFFQIKDFIGDKTGVNAIPSAGVAYAKSNSNSEITVGGNLTAASDIDIDSTSKNTLKISTASTTKHTQAIASVGILVANGENTSKVAINGNLTSANGNVDVKSKTESSIQTEASASAADKTAIVTAVNITTHNSSSDIEIDGNITTNGEGKKVNISSENLVTDNEIITNNSIGTSKFLNTTVFENSDFNNFTSALTTGIKGFLGMNGDDGSTDVKFDLSQYFGIGVTAAIVQENNTSSIKIGKDGVISAKGDVEIASNTTIEDLHIVSKGSANANRKDESKKLESDAAVTYTKLNNSSSVAISGNVTGKTVDINSQVKMEYNRIEKMKEELNQAVEALKNFELAGEAKDAAERFFQKVQEINKIEKNDGMNLGEATLERIAALSEVTGELIAALGEETLGDLTDVIKEALDFASVGNYGNIYSSATAKGAVDTATITGNVAWTDINNSSKVLVDKGAKITAANGDMNISSSNITEVVGIAGTMAKTATEGQNSSTAIGASFIMQNIDTSSIVAVAEGAELISSKGSIEVKADTSVYHTGAAVSAGKGSNGLSGMISYSKGNSDNKISIDDKVLISAEKALKIAAANNTNVTNVAGAFAMGNGNTAIGVGGAINDYSVNNNALIQDNSEFIDKLKKEMNIEKTKDKVTIGENNKITASSFDMSAKTDGKINAVGVAGGVSTVDDSGQPGFFQPIIDIMNKGTNLVKNGVSGVSNYFTGKLEGDNVNSALNMGGTASQSGGTNSSGASQSSTPNFNLTIAGSLALNNLDNKTNAIVDGVVLEIKNGNISVGAEDTSFTGAWAGAAAIQWQNTSKANTQSVGIGGAVGINMIDNTTQAVIKNSTITGANNINIEADSRGSQVAGGLALGISHNGGEAGSQQQGQISISANNIKHNIIAKLENNNVSNVNNRTNISVTAEEEDVQVTGGFTGVFGEANSAIGATVTIANLDNDVTAEINKGIYKDIGNVNVNSLLGVTQVTAAASVGVTKGNAETSLGAINGAVVYNETLNNAAAGIKGATIEANGKIYVTAGDVIPKTKDAQGDKTKEEHIAYLEARGIDATGKTYYENLDTSTDYNAKNRSDTGNGLQNDKNGSTIVSAAAVVGVKAGGSDSTVGAGVTIDKIKNKFNAVIEDSTLTADTVEARASADTFLVGAAGGVAASTGDFGAMGSVSWQEITNDIGAKITGSTITVSNITAEAVNNVYEVNVGGQVSYGKNAAVGAVLAYSNIKNNTVAGIIGGKITASNVTVKADSNSQIITVGAGVGASENAAITGTVAVNMIDNKTEAILGSLDKATVLNNIKNLNVNAVNKNNLTNIVAGVNGAGKVAVGGAVAYSEIGSTVTAGVQGTEITTAITSNDDKERNIIIAATDESDILTVAVAAGGAANAAIEGAAATAIVEKTVKAELNNINIDKIAGERADLDVRANNNGNIIANATVGSGSGSVAVGAGVAVNQITQNTSVALKGGTQNVKEALLKGLSQTNITTIGIGGTGAGSVGVTGSVAVNQIKNNNTVSIEGETSDKKVRLTAKGNAGVIAQSDDVISNYAGTAAGGGAAAVGASASVNQISGDTKVVVDKAEVAAKGETTDTISVNSKVKDDSIIDDIFDEETANLMAQLSKERVEEKKQGLVIDSSATHTVKSLLVTAGGAGTAAVGGTVNVNTIGGNTSVKITDANLNSAQNKSNVYINAKDYINSSGIVGTAAMAGAAGVGVASDTNLIERNVNVDIGKTNIFASEADISAIAKQGVSSTGVGIAGALSGAGVAGTVLVTETASETGVKIADSDIIAVGDIKVNAEHLGRVNTGKISAGGAVTGAGIGAGIGIAKDTSKTTVEILDTDMTAGKNIDIAASNKTDIEIDAVSAGLAATGAGVAGTIGINNIESEVKINIQNKDNTKNYLTGEKVDINAVNDLNLDTKAVTVAGAIEGVGAGAGISINTINSKVGINIDSMNITARTGDVTISADDKKTIRQESLTMGGALYGGVAADVLITNIGEALKGTDEYKKAALTARDEANEAQKKKFGDNSIVAAILGDKGIGETIVEAGTGEDKAENEVPLHIAINGPTNITAESGNINITAGEELGVAINNLTGAGGAVAAVGAVGIVDINRNNLIDISSVSASSGKVSLNAGKDINISNTIKDGTVKIKKEVKEEDGSTKTVIEELKGINLDLNMGGAGIGAVGVAYGEVTSKGGTGINISRSTISGNIISINAKDNSSMAVNTDSTMIGGVAVGVLLANAENNNKVNIEISDSSFTSRTEDDKETGVSIKTEKENKTEVKTHGVSAGLASGAGSDASASDNGTVGVNIVGNGSEFIGNRIDIEASNNSTVIAKANGISGGVIGAGGALSKAQASTNIYLNIASGNTFIGKNINLKAENNSAVTANTEGSGGGAIGINYNEAKAIGEGKVVIDVKDQNYYSNKDKKEQLSDINISGKNNTTLTANAEGVTVGVGVASGNNKAETSNKNLTVVAVGGGTAKNVNITAENMTTNKATTDGSGGGIISVDGMAAFSKNTSSSTAIAAIKGDWNIAGKIDVKALDTNKIILNADSTKGAVIGYSGAKTENNISDAVLDEELKKLLGTEEAKGTKVVLNGKISGKGSINALAKNNIDIDIDTLGSGYGAIMVQGTDADNTVNKSAKVEIKGDTDTNGKQVFEALTEANIDMKTLVKSAGLGAFTIAKADSALTIDNSVTLAAGKTLKTQKADGEITLASSDTTNVKINTTADVQGAAVGGASAATDSKVSRNNKINVNGNIRSMDNVNLYAGTNSTGNKGSLTLTATAETYNKAGIPINTNPKLTSKIDHNNQIVVTAGTKIESVRNINLTANVGKSTVGLTEALYNWVAGDNKDGGFTSSTFGEMSKGETANNYVQINGALTAGIQNKIDITIGADGEIVDFNNDVKNYDGILKGSISKPTIGIIGLDDETKAELLEKIESGKMDYGKELLERYDQVGQLLVEYSKDGKDSSVYAGYKAELDRLAEQMEALGLLGDVMNLEIQYIEIPDLVVSGGNIAINADNLTGSGTLKAQGAEGINITNNTNLYMKVNNVQIGEQGGEIIFRGTSLGSGTVEEQLDTINSLNTNGLTASFKDIKTTDPGDTTINITNNWNGSATIKFNNGSEGNVTPLSSLEINGAIVNKLGTVNIANKGGDIIIQGNKEGTTSAGVIGKDVSLTAKGSVAQGYTQGIVNIGGDPEAQWKNVTDQVIGNIKNDKTNIDGNKNNVVYNKPNGTNPENVSNNMIAGDNIYINADDINVNGYIQSGYADYNLNLDEKNYAQRIEDLKQQWEANGKGEVNSGNLQQYKLNDGGPKVGKNGEYVYVPQAYYNPATDEIIVEDIEAKGGKVYLTGRILSTGSGKIVALDGTTDITITNNNIDKELKLGNIDNGNIDGLIKITDNRTSKDGKITETYITEYTRGGVVTKQLVKTENKFEEKEVDGSKFYTDAGGKYTYKPDEGLRYNWTNGTKSTTETKYTYGFESYLWGAIKSNKDLINAGNKTEFDNNPDYNKEFIPSGTDVPRPNGTFVGKVDGVNNNEDYQLIYNNKITDNTKSEIHETVKSKFLGFYKDVTLTWTVTEGAVQSYQSSVKADKGIEIGFIGKDQGTINVTNKGNIELAGNIKSNKVEGHAKYAGTVDINSTTGSIYQSGGNIYSDNITLNAAKGISGVDGLNITSMSDTVNLTAKNSGSGNINLNVNAGYLNNVRQKGNVIVGEILTQSGNVSLNAAGNISQAVAGTASVKGDRIDLTSREGGINLIVQGGTEATNTDTMSSSINASAKNNIILAQEKGDFRIGRVHSQDGDVTINVGDGSLVDALPTGEEIPGNSAAEKIERWEEQGLIVSEDKRQEKIKQDIADYESNIRSEYNQYKNIEQLCEDIKNNPNIDSSAKETILVQYDKIKEKYKNYDSAESYLAQNSEYKEEIASSKYQWNKESLLYAIQDSVANPEAGSTQKEAKDPNIKGNNITINASKGVGIDTETKEYKISDLYAGDIDTLKALAGAEAADVKWDYDNGKVYIDGKNAVGIEMKSSGGKLNVTAKENIYLAARTDVGSGNSSTNAIYVDNITTDGNIRLLGTGGVYNVTTTGKDNFIGNNLILEGGTGSLGESGKALTMNLKGSLTARGDKEIYLHQTKGDMNIAAIYAGKGINLISAGNILSTNVNVGSSAGSTSGSDGDKEDENLILGYINAGDEIVLEAAENIGTSEQGVNILNGKESMVGAKGNNIYLTGKKEGELLLGNINAKGNAEINSDDSIRVAGNVKVVGDTKLTAEKNIVLESVNKDITTIDTANLNMTAIAGSINQSLSNTIITNIVTAHANEGISLTGEANKFNSINLANNSGDILVNNIGINGLAVKFDKNKNIGNIEISNITGDMKIVGSIEAVENNLTFKNGTGDITVAEDTNLTAGKDILVKAGSGSINTNNSVITAGNDIVVNASENIETAGNIKAENDISMSSSAGKINTNSSEIKANHNVNITAAKDIINNNIVTAGNNLLAQSNTGNIKLSNLNGGNRVDAATTTGNITIGGTVTASKDGINIQTSAGDIALTGSLTSGTSTTLKAKTGSINLTKKESEYLVQAGKDINIETKIGNITLDGNLIAKENVDIAVNNGDITTNGNIIATSGDIKVLTNNIGNIASVGNITGRDVMFTTQTGNIKVNENRNGLTVNSGNNFIVQTATGDIILGGTVKSGNEAKAETTTNGNINIKNIISQNDMYVLTNVGNIEIGNAESINGKVYIKSSGKGGIVADNIGANTTADIFANVGDININTLAANGEVNITTSTEGNITSGTSLKSINDSMKVYSAKGDIELNDVYAKKVAETVAKDGNIYIKLINGDFVIVTLGKKDKEMIIDKEIVGKGAIISSNNVIVEGLNQREGEDNVVEITFKSSEDNANSAIDNIELHAQGIKHGIKVNQLWVHNAEISTDSNVLQFPELVVTGKGHFSNSSTTTTVYGENSVYDNSNIHIWNDADAKEWIVLNFLPTANTVFTDGRLLKLQDGYNVYNQRITAEDYMIEHLKDYNTIEYKINEVRNPFRYVYKPYLNYDLVENDFITPVVNAAELITIENQKIIIKENGKVTELTLEPSIRNDKENEENRVTAAGTGETIKAKFNEGIETKIFNLEPTIKSNEDEEEKEKVAVLEKNEK
ncbi:hypothetical protein [Fusobacterium varium]|uniref:hypothetical protein n=1 Tax=Fusobacterium varium TaxID=856 RepID=UPI00241CD178|nr:hypothetical protein [Fusobacterium varium]